MRRRPIRPLPVRTLTALGCWVAGSAQAFSVGITPGVRALYLQVGVGQMTGGTFSSGTGVPGNNSTVNSVSTTVAANAIGSGSQTMATDSTTTQSPYDNFTFCTITATAGQVYVGGFYRTPGTGAAATLSVATPASLLNATSETLPFSSVSWTSSGLGDSGTTIPAGTFAGGTTQTLLSVSLNTWFESCLLFSYANAQFAPAGTFSGRATYTLIAP